MWKCKACGEKFYEPETQYTIQWHNELDDGERREYIPLPLCPYCGAEEIEEIQEDDEDDE